MRAAKSFSRRDFLKLAGAGVCAACLAACGKAPVAMNPQAYWQENYQTLLDDFDRMMTPARKWIAEKTGEGEADAILRESRAGYEVLLPQVAYIGGESNSLTETLYMAAAALAFYKTMLAHGQTLDDTGEVLYRTVEGMINFNDPMSGAHMRDPNGRAAQDEFRRMARQSQDSPYPGDWKLSFVEGDGQNFDFGVDYTECGIVKFYREQHASELATYLCLGDFALSKAIDSGLARTTTLARGGKYCDFRFKAGRRIQMEWTPDFLK